MKQKIEGGEEVQMRILSKCSPELIQIVGKHSTLWNYSKLETVERIANLLASERQRCVEACKKDKERLDFLDKLNKGLNDHYGTTYGWKMIVNHNVNRLFNGELDSIDLNDVEVNGFESCREAIDQAKHNLLNTQTLLSSKDE